jgi:hypothetical protein
MIQRYAVHYKSKIYAKAGKGESFITGLEINSMNKRTVPIKLPASETLLGQFNGDRQYGNL